MSHGGYGSSNEVDVIQSPNSPDSFAIPVELLSPYVDDDCCASLLDDMKQGRAKKNNGEAHQLYNYDDEDGAVNHEYSDSEEDAYEDMEEETLTGALREWTVEEGVTNSALDKLLRILHDHHPHLPITARTLLKTGQHSSKIKKISGGEYVHFGILNSMRQFEMDIIKMGHEVVEYQINIDGLPLFRSSGLQLWPILGRIVGTKRPFLIGAFCGSSKPGSIDEFCEDFISEALELCDMGFWLHGVKYRAQIACFICDAPARSFIKQTKSHTGYYGCERCIQKGEYTESRVIFPKTDSEKREDEAFARQEYTHHQVGKSPLTGLNVGLVSGCILDYMHLVCLGVVRRIIFFWLKGSLKTRLSSRQVNIVSQGLVSLRGHIPSEFVRKPRSFSELEYWKASEFRQFILYTGLIVLKSQLSKKLYEHFCCLSVIMHMLLSPSLCMHYCDYVDKLLIVWIKRSQKLYGRHFVVYNVHSLLHLVDDVRKFGNLDNISSFPFENFMRCLKSAIRKPQKVLEQLANRVAEGYFNNKTCEAIEHGVRREHTCGPVLSGLIEFKQYRELQLNNFTIKLTSGDNCLMCEGKVALVQNIFSDGSIIKLVVKKFKKMTKFFTRPLPSSDIGIYEVYKLSSQFDVCSLSDIQNKYVLLPYNSSGKWIAIPLIHSAEWSGI